MRDELRERVRHTLGQLLPRGSRCALVNYPNNANPGDSAIWLGEHTLLAELDVEIVYSCEWRSYSRRALARALDGDTTILLHGGGNFGDLYSPGGQQLVRERVLEQFPHVRTIQLPQSIQFADRSNLDRMRRLVDAHRDFTLLVREEQSRERARAAFDAPIELCPDMALALPAPPDPPQAPGPGVGWLVQSVARERLSAPEPPDEAGVRPFDWPTAYPGRATAESARNAALMRQMRLWPPVRASRWPELARTFEPLARARVESAFGEIGRAPVLVSERLHGLILALLCDTPVVALDYNYGKTRSFHATWLRDCPATLMAPSADEALLTARRMLDTCLRSRP